MFQELETMRLQLKNIGFDGEQNGGNRIESVMGYQIIRLTEKPEMKEQMAQWFHEKWGISKEAYLESMTAYLEGKNTVPAWYAAIDGDRIIGGMGVIGFANAFQNQASAVAVG